MLFGQLYRQDISPWPPRAFSASVSKKGGTVGAHRYHKLIQLETFVGQAVIGSKTEDKTCKIGLHQKKTSRRSDFTWLTFGAREHGQPVEDQPSVLLHGTCIQPKQ